MKFTIAAKDSNSSARAATIELAHGPVHTPIFMPVGTAATVKGVHQRELQQEIKPDIILGNTYHLYLRPQTAILQKAGGLHKFMNWEGNILTDSGGYQVYSLSGNRKIKEEGVKFKSHIDGSLHLFTPENVMDIQRQIGADIIMAFDECTPYPCDKQYARDSMHMTHRWLDRCLVQLEKSPELYGFEQVFFPIVQGSTYSDLRRESAEYIASVGAQGNAIGGLSVGEPAEEMYAMTQEVTAILPQDKPRYLMGVGTPINILENIALGIDMFDCVLPTRLARHGTALTTEGKVILKSKRYEFDLTPLDPNLKTISSPYTKSYLRHLYKAEELLVSRLVSIQNLAYLKHLMKEIREAIKEDRLYDYYLDMQSKTNYFK